MNKVTLLMIIVSIGITLFSWMVIAAKVEARRMGLEN